MCLPSFDCTPDKTFALGVEVEVGTVNNSRITKGGQQRGMEEDFACLLERFVWCVLVWLAVKMNKMNSVKKILK